MVKTIETKVMEIIEIIREEKLYIIINNVRTSKPISVSCSNYRRNGEARTRKSQEDREGY